MQVVQAKGVMTESAYFKVVRTGRGTALDRKTRASLWKTFSDYRASMIDEGLAEPDDAYREAIEILKAEAPSLPYGAVVVDEAQDMGRAGVPSHSRNCARKDWRRPQLDLYSRRCAPAHLWPPRDHDRLRNKRARPRAAVATELPDQR
jgi:hypothetical protein